MVVVGWVTDDELLPRRRLDLAGFDSTKFETREPIATPLPLRLVQKFTAALLMIGGGLVCLVYSRSAVPWMVLDYDRLKVRRPSSEC